MTKEELFKNLIKNDYVHETTMKYPSLSNHKGHDYTISVLVKNENDEWKCRRELFFHNGKYKFFMLIEIKLEEEKLVFTGKNIKEEDMYEMFWRFVRNGEVQK